MSPTAAPAITRPDRTEFNPYFSTYVDKVPDGPILDVLERQLPELVGVLEELGEARGSHRYAPGKWSVKEVVGHLIDAERIFAYRALRAARGDRTPLPSFEQDDYVRAAGSDARALRDLIREAEAVRRATLTLFGGLDAEALARRGIASGAEFSVRAMAYIIAGHERHHLLILRERYW